MTTQADLQAILKASFEAGLLLDGEKHVLFWNESAQKLFRIDQDSTQIPMINELIVAVSPTSKPPVPWNEIPITSEETISVVCKRHDGESTNVPAKARVANVGSFSLVFLSPSDDTNSSSQKSLAASMVEASLDPVFSIDASGVIQMVNTAACRLFGYTRDEFVGSNISMICGGDTHSSQHDTYMTRFLETNVARVMGKKRKLPARKKDGSELIIELSVVEIKNDTEHLFCGYVRDLSDILESQANLEQERNLIAGVIDAALDPLVHINEKGIIQMVNKAATEQFGWTKEEFVGRNISIIVGVEHAANHDAYIDRYLRTGEARVMGTQRELKARRKDGSDFIIRLSLVEVGVQDGHERMFAGFIHDLTEEKAQQERLQRERNLVAGVIEAALDPLIQIDEKGIIQMVNAAATTQFGWTSEEFIGSNISIIVGGEHAANHDAYIDRYLRTGEARVMGTQRELKARRKDGSEFFIHLSLVEVFVTNGHEERIFCGFIHDLTQQKQHLAEIQRSEAFTNKIIEGSYDALLVTNKDGTINRVNAAALKLFQSPSTESLCTKSIFTFFLVEDASWLENEMEHFVNVGIPMTTQREVVALKCNFETCPVILDACELEGPEGEVFFAFYLHDLSERKKMMQIEAEKCAAEYLLFNMLPEQIAGRLQNDPSHIADSHKFAAVLFADIVGFTSMSSTMEPHEVVSMLNDLFSMFDEVVEKYGLNKVKTIGDCYMVTSVPALVDQPEDEHCRRLCHFGLDMISALHKYNDDDHRERKLDLRVGINCGPVVAGVVGTKRFLYDLWGDAVNLASRMESTGIPGKIQTTSHVVALVEDDFVFEKRGLVHVKGKGEVETHFLSSRKKEYTPSPRRVMYTRTPNNSRRLEVTNSMDMRQTLMNFKAGSDVTMSLRDLSIAFLEPSSEDGDD